MKSSRQWLAACADAYVDAEPSNADQETAMAFFRALAATLPQDPALRRALYSGTPAARTTWLDRGLAKRLAPAALLTLRLVVAHSKPTEFRWFVERLTRAREQRGQAKHVSVTSAVPLTATSREQLRRTLEEKWRVPVTLEETVDPAVLGGLRLRSGAWLYDLTLTSRLDRLARTLSPV
jgi:F-type H+-transporting ATPase subunit delta